MADKLQFPVITSRMAVERTEGNLRKLQDIRDELDEVLGVPKLEKLKPKNNLI